MSKELFDVESISDEEMQKQGILLLAKAAYQTEEAKEEGEYRLQTALHAPRGQLVDIAINILTDVAISCATTNDGQGELNPPVLLDFYQEIKQKVEAIFGTALRKFTLDNPDIFEKMLRGIAEEENKQQEQ